MHFSLAQRNAIWTVWLQGKYDHDTDIRAFQIGTKSRNNILRAMVIIEEIKWLSKEGLEAQVVISNGKYKLICFAHPFNGKMGDEVMHPLYALQVDYLFKSHSKEFLIEKSSEPFSYLLVGKVVNKRNRLIKLGDIEIEIDVPMPEDINNEDFVSFRCERVDLV